MKYNVIRLLDRPDIKERAAEWFHEVTSVMDGNFSAWCRGT